MQAEEEEPGQRRGLGNLKPERKAQATQGHLGTQADTAPGAWLPPLPQEEAARAERWKGD